VCLGELGEILMAKEPTYEEVEQRVKQFERKARQEGPQDDQKATLLRFAEASGQGLGMADLEGYVTYANPTLCRLMGEERPEDPIGKHVRTYVPEEELSRLEDEILPAVFKDGQKTVEISFLSIKGHLTPTIQNVFLIPDDKGEPLYIANVITDITDRKEMEMALRENMDRLEIAYDQSIVFAEELTEEIIERRQAEEALRESEQRSRELAELLPVSVFELDVYGKFTYTNRCGLETFGYTREDLHGGVKALQLFAQEERQRVEENIRKRMAGEEFEDHEYTMLKKDGTRLCGLLSTAPIIRNGNPAGVRGIVLDITDRKDAEEALRESEGKYRSVVERASDGIGIVQDGLLKYANPRLADIGGYAVEEVMGKPFADFVHPDDVAETVECYTRRLQGDDAPARYETKLLHKSGRTVQAEVSGGVITYQNRTADLAIVRDITERKRAEEALRESEERYSQLFATVPDASMIFDAETRRFLDVNASALDLYGYTEEEFLNLKLSDITAESDASDTSVEQTLAGELTQVPLRYHKKKDGTVFPVEISAGTFHLGARNVLCGLVRDITRRNQAEEALKQSREELRELASHLEVVREKERGRIAREIHDELGQALTALKMDLHWLAGKLPREEPLLAKTRTMSNLIDVTVQSVQRISSELRPGLLDNLGLSAAVEWQAREFQERTGILLGIEIDPEEIVLDRDRSTAIFRIFQETLTNVTRHAKASKVEVLLKEKPDAIELKVRDNGRGVTEDQMSDPRSFGLMGMRERVHGLRGNLAITGTPNKGTTVLVNIPREKEEASDAKSIHRR